MKINDFIYILVFSLDLILCVSILLIYVADDEEYFSSLLLQPLPSDLIEALDTDSLILIKTSAKVLSEKQTSQMHLQMILK